MMLLLGLSAAGGSADAATYLGLAHVFPANMTGNTVLLAIAVAQGTGREAARSGIALGAFCAGVALGTAALSGAQPWPRSAVRTLSLEALALTALLVVWAVRGPHPRLALIAAAAGAMGAQSAAVRASHVGGVSTTYVTGTLTTTVARLVGRTRRARAAQTPSPAVPGGSWIFYALGALAGAFAVDAWHSGVMAIPLAFVLVSALRALGQPGMRGA